MPSFGDLLDSASQGDPGVHSRPRAWICNAAVSQVNGAAGLRRQASPMPTTLILVTGSSCEPEWSCDGKEQTEAFSDAVLAIIITIMVLEMKVPHGDSIEALSPLIPVLLSYVLSFLYLGIYWNNHHHMTHACHRATGSMLWANLHLLFWLSLIPFTTGWMGEHHSATLPAAAYGVVLLMAAIAYLILQGRIVASQGAHSLLGRAIGTDWKGKLSPVLYVAAIGVRLRGSLLSFMSSSHWCGLFQISASNVCSQA
jgi:uncharacterized membrane protein